MKEFHFHLISDSTGETVITVSRACLAQFDNIVNIEHVWSMTRNKGQIKKIVAFMEKTPGFVIFTLVDAELRTFLEDECRKINIPYFSLLDPLISTLAKYLGEETIARPGKQHIMDAEYFNRIDAVHFALSHDDGQSMATINQADVIILGVSRTSKTPTCIYLANRGIKAANVPIIPGSPLPTEIALANSSIVVGLVNDPKRLVQIRRNRLRLLKRYEISDYIDIDSVEKEVNDTRRLFAKQNWPVIDVTRKSIEEVAATIMQLYNQRKDQVSTET